MINKALKCLFAITVISMTSCSLLGCREEVLKEGDCYTEDGSICISNMTKKMCDGYNIEKKDGHSWQFGLCPPPTTGN